MESGSKKQVLQEMLDENYFVGRKDLESKGLEWGGTDSNMSITLERFKLLMRIELNKYPPTETNSRSIFFGNNV
jgi:hypothetical protein